MKKDFSIQVNIFGDITDKEKQIIETIKILGKENGFRVKVILEEVYDNELGEIELSEEVVESDSEDIKDTITENVLVSAAKIFYEID